MHSPGNMEIEEDLRERISPLFIGDKSQTQVGLGRSGDGKGRR
jgi:hypothetical protein